MSWSVSTGGPRDFAIGEARKQLERIKVNGLPAAEVKRAEVAVESAIELAEERAGENDSVSISAWGSETAPDSESYKQSTHIGLAQWSVSVMRAVTATPVPAAPVTEGE